VLVLHSIVGSTAALAPVIWPDGSLSTVMCRGVMVPAGWISAALALLTELAARRFPQIFFIHSSAPFTVVSTSPSTAL
jgi:hypothetical protein